MPNSADDLPKHSSHRHHSSSSSSSHHHHHHHKKSSKKNDSDQHDEEERYKQIDLRDRLNELKRKKDRDSTDRDKITTQDYYRPKQTAFDYDPYYKPISQPPIPPPPGAQYIRNYQYQHHLDKQQFIQTNQYQQVRNYNQNEMVSLRQTQSSELRRHTSGHLSSSSSSLSSSSYAKSKSSPRKSDTIEKPVTTQSESKTDKLKKSKLINDAEVSEIVSDEDKSSIDSAADSDSDNEQNEEKKKKKLKSSGGEKSESDNENDEGGDESRSDSNEENENEDSEKEHNSDQSASESPSSKNKEKEDEKRRIDSEDEDDEMEPGEMRSIGSNESNNSKRLKNNKNTKISSNKNSKKKFSNSPSDDSTKSNSTRNSGEYVSNKNGGSDVSRKSSNKKTDESDSNESDSTEKLGDDEEDNENKSQNDTNSTEQSNSSSGEDSNVDSEKEQRKKSTKKSKEEKKKNKKRKSKEENEESGGDDGEVNDEENVLNENGRHHHHHHKKSSKKAHHSKKSKKKSSRSRSKSEEADLNKKEETTNDDKTKEQQQQQQQITTAATFVVPPQIIYYCATQGCRSVEEFECLNKIEEGAYGVVYRAKDKKSNEVVALKRLKMEKEREGFPITSLREVDTLLKAQHPNIVTVREIVVGSNMDKIYMVMDYVEHDLKSLMQYGMKKPFLMSEVKTLMIQLLRGVAHLHDNWIIHRDLKTSNLLLSHKGILKIADFGLAREYGSPLKEYTAVVVTLWYRSPELLLNTKKYSTSIDIWSVGCIFGELMLMKALFPGKNEKDQLDKIFKELGTPNDKIWPNFKDLPLTSKLNFQHFPYNTLRSRFGSYLSDKGFELINKLLTYDPERRISAEEALKHEFFKETPLPIDPSMFPTWPAKSEGMTKHKLSQDSEPRAPSAGKMYEKLISEDDGFVLQFPTISTGFKFAGL